jgi:hypothetical protein
MPVIAAFPYITVTIVPPPPPTAQRAPGVIAVVGKTPGDAAGGSVAANVPKVVETLTDAANFFAKVNPDGSIARTALYDSLEIAMAQNPRPSKIYGVRVAGDGYAEALSSIEGLDDITFVGLAKEVAVGTAAGNTGLNALKRHVETVSAAGLRRVGVAMVDPARPKSNTYVADTVAAVDTAPDSLKSSVGRVILVAARGAAEDTSTAAMASIAGYAPHVSIVLKTINGVQIPKASQFSPSEIKQLSEAGIIPIIDPTLIVGESLHFADGRTFTSDARWLYVDFVRVIDDIEFRLKAGLIGAIGDSRITKEGLTTLKTRVEGILGPLKRAAVIDDFFVEIPVLDILNLPENTRTATDNAIVTTARQDRNVDLTVTITYGPAVHRLGVKLVVKF